MPIRFSRRAPSFTASGWHGRHWFTKSMFLKAVDALTEMDIIDGLLGFNDRRNKKKARQSRYWATDFLKSKFDEFLGGQVVERLPPERPITLRDKDKNNISLEKMGDGQYGISMSEYYEAEDRLNIYNDFASKQEVLLPLDSAVVTYDFLLKLRQWYTKGMIDIYKVENWEEILKHLILYNYKDTSYLHTYRNTYITNSKHSYKYFNTIPLLEQLSSNDNIKKITHWDIPYNKHKAKKTIILENFIIHIKWNYVKRVFNNSTFLDGGRCYGNVIQSLPNRSRKIDITPLRGKLLINGYETVELDYKSIHPSILYNKYLNMKYEGDLYEGDYDRKIIKYAFLTMLNSKDTDGTRSNTIIGIRKKLYDEGCFPEGGLTDENILKIIEFIEEKHKLIKDFIGSGIGIQLMRIDSDIASDVMENLRLKNIFASPVHDSFVVKKQHEQDLREEMERCYFKHVGYVPMIDKK